MYMQNFQKGRTFIQRFVEESLAPDDINYSTRYITAANSYDTCNTIENEEQNFI